MENINTVRDLAVKIIGRKIKTEEEFSIARGKLESLSFAEDIFVSSLFYAKNKTLKIK